MSIHLDEPAAVGHLPREPTLKRHEFHGWTLDERQAAKRLDIEKAVMRVGGGVPMKHSLAHDRCREFGENPFINFINRRAGYPGAAT